MCAVVIVFNFPFADSHFTGIKHFRVFGNFSGIHCTCDRDCLKRRPRWEYISQSPVFNLQRGCIPVIVRVIGRINSIRKNFAVFRVHNNYGSAKRLFFRNHFFQFFFADMLDCSINGESYILTFWIHSCCNCIC